MTGIMKSSADVITEDLELLATQLRDELRRMSGSSVLVAVAGGAGFLGYYLVQARDRDDGRERRWAATPPRLHGCVDRYEGVGL